MQNLARAGYHHRRVFEYTFFESRDKPRKRDVRKSHIELIQNRGDAVCGIKRAMFVLPNFVMTLCLDAASLLEFRMRNIALSQHGLCEQTAAPLLIECEEPGFLGEQRMPKIETDCFDDQTEFLELCYDAASILINVRRD